MAGPSSNTRGSSTAERSIGADAEETLRSGLADRDPVDAPVARRRRYERSGDDGRADVAVADRQAFAEHIEFEVERGGRGQLRRRVGLGAEHGRDAIDQRLRHARSRGETAGRGRLRHRADVERHCLERRRRLGIAELPALDERRRRRSRCPYRLEADADRHVGDRGVGVGRDVFLPRQPQRHRHHADGRQHEQDATDHERPPRALRPMSRRTRTPSKWMASTPA